MNTGCGTCGLRGCADPVHGAVEPGAVRTVALAGNPNVGKTSVFNALTGLRQHTGNWPGKTVIRAEGSFQFDGRSYTVVDLPGTYSLSARSVEEEVARDFICFGRPDVTVVVTDATALERNLNLALQVAEVTDRMVVCVNLLDEARRKRIAIDLPALADELGVPVVGTVARTGHGMAKLKEMIDRVAWGRLPTDPRPVVYGDKIEAAIADLLPRIRPLVGDHIPPRWVALRLLEGDTGAIDRIAASLEPLPVIDSIPLQASR